jgi:hypothetical protein
MAGPKAGLDVEYTRQNVLRFVNTWSAETVIGSIDTLPSQPQNNPPVRT